LASCFLLSY
ncbi:mviN-like family protein, partial [Chlamydia psittaci 06-1683]